MAESRRKVKKERIMSKGRTPVVQPALEKAYGAEWQTKFKDICNDLTLEEATVCLNMDLGISVSTGAIYTHARKLGIVFNKSLNSSGELKGKRGKKSTTIPLLLSHFGTEEALKEFLQKQAGNKIKDIASSINVAAGTEIADFNIYNLLKRYEIGVSCKRTRKTVSTSIMFGSEVPDGKEVKPSRANETPVKFICTTAGCNHSFGNTVNLAIGLGLRARRCPQCNTFGTYRAQYKNPDGSIASIILKDVEDGLCEVLETQ